MSSIRTHDSADGALDAIEAAIETVGTTLVVSTPVGALPRLESAIRTAAGRDILVLLLLGDADVANPRVPSGVDGLIRALDVSVPAVGIVDQEIAWAGASSLLDPDVDSGRTLSVVKSTDIAQMLFAGFQGTYWERGDEQYVRDRRTFPATYDRFQHGVVDATLALRDGIGVTATAVGRLAGTDEEIVVEGRIVTSRQGYVYPSTTSIPGQNGLVLERPDGTAVTLGGEGAIREDIEVLELTLRTNT